MSLKESGDGESPQISWCHIFTLKH